MDDEAINGQFINGQAKTNSQLISELESLRQELARLKVAEAERERMTSSDSRYTQEQLAQRLQESQAMLQISQMLSTSLDLAQTLSQILSATVSVIPSADQVLIHLLNKDGSSLDPQAAWDERSHPLSSYASFKPGQGVPGMVITSGQTMYVPEAPENLRFTIQGIDRLELRSLLVAPVKTAEKTLGTISIYSRIPGVFSVKDARLLTVLGPQAAVAIEKAILYADLQTTLLHEQAARMQLVQTEKLAALGRIVASVAHELNNPLQAIQNALYLIRQEETLSPQSQEDLCVALKEANRMADLIARLRDTYRPTLSSEFHPESLNEIFVEVQRLISTHLRQNQIEYQFEPDFSLPLIPMIHDQIKQVILNISLNAVESMTARPNPEKTRVLKAYTRCLVESDEAMFVISDTGLGIDSETLPYIFDPFFTTKEGGTGLGLAITYDLIRQHNGRIEVASEIGRGTTFLIYLPLAQEPAG